MQTRTPKELTAPVKPMAEAQRAMTIPRAVLRFTLSVNLPTKRPKVANGRV